MTDISLKTKKIINHGHVVITDGRNDIHFLIRDNLINMKWYLDKNLQNSLHIHDKEYYKDILYYRHEGRKVYNHFIETGVWNLVLCEENYSL